MGFGLPGRFTVPEQADALRDLAPHVIVLSEVDRAWFLNGGHDDLRLIADRLGMRYLWAAAADEVWGDALLTNLPVISVRNHPLVQGGPTGAQALEVVLEWDNAPITVIATHLQPPPRWTPLDQVEQLADIVRAAQKPVILAGDLNIRPGEPAWDVLMSTGLQDAFADVRPFYTTPSEEDEQIDHILVSPGWTASDPANPDLDISDHRPVAVTLRRGGAQG
jgi:endonuclease/exonuclease/phosphatase family metal-dependent hydrolase